MSTFKQAAHPLLVIPGPIEVVDSVLLANASPSVSHTSPGFAKIFQNSLRMLRKLLYTKDGQPFLVAGAGTLGWDMVASNLVEPGEHALVVNSGYFGDAFVGGPQAASVPAGELTLDAGRLFGSVRCEGLASQSTCWRSSDLEADRGSFVQAEVQG